MKRNKDGSATVTREELYKEVWSEPVRLLAKKYGLSDVGLAKLCKKHQIPRPPVGFWAKRKVGKKVQKTKLPPLTDPALEIITIRRRPEGYDRAHATEMDRLANPDGPGITITVKKRLASPHPLVARTSKSLQVARPDERGLLRSSGKNTLSISIGPKSVPRAMRILDALIQASESRSFKIDTTTEARRGIRVSINGESIDFVLFERLKQEGRELTPSEQRDGPWLTGTKEYTYHPSGRLCLQITNYRGEFARRTWTDGKKQRLETCLGDFIAAMLETSDAIKLQRQERERERREYEARQREREEKLGMIREEEKRIARLEAEASDWERSERIRKYVQKVRAAAADSDGDVRNDEALERWVEWALAQADRLDPLVKSPPSILDEK